MKSYIPIERVRALQESIGWLNTYESDNISECHIGPNINTIDVRETKLLRELGLINKRRKQIIFELCQK